jgi:hypothetical protein
MPSDKTQPKAKVRRRNNDPKLRLLWGKTRLDHNRLVVSGTTEVVFRARGTSAFYEKLEVTAEVEISCPDLQRHLNYLIAKAMYNCRYQACTGPIKVKLYNFRQVLPGMADSMVFGVVPSVAGQPYDEWLEDPQIQRCCQVWFGLGCPMRWITWWRQGPKKGIECLVES